ALAGAPPFVAGSVAQLVAMHLGEEPVPLAKRRPSVPADLSMLVMPCLRKRPADRWQTARELIAEVDRVDLAEDGATREPRAPGTVMSRLPISEALASRLDRTRFDP